MTGDRKAKMRRPDWDQVYFSMMYIFGLRSSDPNTKVGALIVNSENILVSAGYNGWPRYIQEMPEGDKRLERPLKYKWIEHGERNAIYNAGRMGVSLEGCSLYISGVPCTDCARAIIQSGIIEVIVHSEANQLWLTVDGSKDQWSDDNIQSCLMLAEAHVKIKYWDGKLLEPIFYHRNQENLFEIDDLGLLTRL